MSSETDAADRSSADGEDGYVHDPADGDAGSADSDTDGAVSAAETPGPTADGPESATEAMEPTADGFGRKGWALTAVLFTCVLVIPGIIYAYPYAAGAFGFTFFATYLALPLVPAVLLGLVAVWSMTAATE
ncbi:MULTISPECIES: hypothetical protein [Haloferacaceae]|uniref:Cox cluster protein n=1 Tax=Halorubrum glutamatedens TaxID=2707018 RepID=A0ABD5QPA9_9EURY|nr:hypothetical protein [Halobellus captivus]